MPDQLPVNESTPPIHRGACLCGAVRYQVQGPPLVVAHCHCCNCQRGSGAGHSTGAMFRDDRFRLTGEVAEYKLHADNGNEVTRVFCPVCGSPILGRNSGTRGYLTITLGTLEDSAAFEPEVVIFARNRRHWDAMDERLATFAAQPDWKPDKPGDNL